MLHDETRKLLIEAWNKTHNAKEIAECFSVNTSTVYRLEKQMREIATGQLGQAFHCIHKSTLSGQYCPDHCNDPEDHNDSLDKVIDGSGHISSKDHIDAGKGSHKDHTHRIRNVKSHPEQSGQAII